MNSTTHNSVPLKEWVLDLKNQSHFYNSGEWKYRVTGNLLEFSVPHSITNRKQLFRCSVITIGQVLRAISTKIESSGAHYHIQSFPNLEAPELIASIRIDEQFNRSENPFPALDDKLINITGKEQLTVISEKYGFQLTEISHPLNLELRLDNLENKTWFLLTSKQNNPFTWLHLGNWKESVLRVDPAEPDSDSMIVFDFCMLDSWKKIKNKFSIPDYLQAMIAVDNH